MKYADPYNTKTLADKMAGLIDRQKKVKLCPNCHLDILCNFTHDRIQKTNQINLSDKNAAVNMIK